MEDERRRAMLAAADHLTRARDRVERSGVLFYDSESEREARAFREQVARDHHVSVGALEAALQEVVGPRGKARLEDAAWARARGAWDALYRTTLRAELIRVLVLILGVLVIGFFVAAVMWFRSQ